MWFTYVFVAVSVVAYAEAFRDGAPETACQDMIPRHPVDPQASPPPYIITTSTQVAKGGVPMQVTISGKTPTDTIKGLILQARHGNQIVGKFSIPPNDPFAKVINCGTPGNAVTHKRHDPSLDKKTVTFTWTPPTDLNGDVKFRATVALNGGVFWVGVESAPVKIAS